MTNGLHSTCNFCLDDDLSCSCNDLKACLKCWCFFRRQILTSFWTWHISNFSSSCIDLLLHKFYVICMQNLYSTLQKLKLFAKFRCPVKEHIAQLLKGFTQELFSACVGIFPGFSTCQSKNLLPVPFAIHKFILQPCCIKWSPTHFTIDYTCR